MRCTWCGKEITGEVVALGWEGELVYFDGNKVLEPEKTLVFVVMPVPGDMELSIIGLRV